MTGTGIILSADIADYRSPHGEIGQHHSRQLTPYGRFSQMARLLPDKVALVSSTRRLTYCELDDMVRAFARGLTRLAVAPGEAIGVACGNRWELAPLFLACSAAGIVFTAFNPMLTLEELAWQVGELRPRLFLHERHTLLEDVLAADDGQRIEPWADEHGPLMVRFSSGTTGKPKAMVSSQRAQMELYRAVADIVEMCDDDIHLVTGPLGHAPLHIGLAQLMVGGTTVLLGRFDKTRFWQDCAEYGATNAMVVPTMISGALDHPGDAPALRRLMSTAATLAPALKQRLMTRFPALGLVEAYGSSELGFVSGLRAHDQSHRPQSVGRPIPGQEIGIFDDAGRPLPRGEIGIIHVRSPMCLTRYVGSVRPTPTMAEMHGEGWVTSGDLGFLDAEGYLHISDRRVDLILSGGLNVYPAEVEAVLCELPGVRDVAVVGIADEHWGQRVYAYVEGDAAEDAMLAHCRARLASYKVPRAVHVVPGLPRTSSGKTSRKLVRDMIASGNLPH